jgi:FlaA1/EpsC-like NDP-sugar epimerase
MVLLRLRNRHLFLLDMVLLALAPTLALALRMDFVIAQRFVPALLIFTGLALAVKLPFFLYFRLYNRYWRYASMDELVTIVFAVLGSSLAVALLFYGGQGVGLWPALTFPRSVSVLDAGLTLVAVGGLRFSVRAAEHRRMRRHRHAGDRRVLIVGAGSAGSLLANELRANQRAGLDPVGFVDDDPAKRGMRIHDVPVLGARANLAALVQEVRADEVIIAMPSAPGVVIREIVAACKQAGVPSRTLPSLAELAAGQATASRLRPVNIEDLLRREPVSVDLAAVRAMLSGKCVLVTGAGGSIGSELCRQIARCGPARLIALGHGENSLFELSNDLHRGLQTVPGALSYDLRLVVADIRDRPRLQSVFQQWRPEVVFHAAAHKHVPLMEFNLEDAVSNNVLGTRHVVELAEQYAAKRFVLISSDKAVNPVSVMGVTKRVAELIVAETADRCGRPFVSVRFGNVLGSRGSVVPLLSKQIAEGGPVTLTHPDMKRYFMTIPEAVQLVLQAAVLGEAGRVFVLDMGEPIRLVDLAHDLIRLSGLEVGRDIETVFTGLRPGEKLFEELFGGQEHFDRTRHTKIFVARNGHQPAEPLRLDEQVDRLIAAAQAGRSEEARRWLQSLVPEYRPAGSDPKPVASPPLSTARPLLTPTRQAGH